MPDKKRLNEEQLQAVKHKKGPLLIIAGAGTGKTTVITERIKYIISKNLAKPSEILALTFTEKAAAEMQERVDIALPYGYTQMWISTFHSFCDRILRSQVLQIGLNPGYKLNTQAESIAFIRKNLFKFDLEYYRPLGNPTKFIDGMLNHFSRLQDEDVSPSDYVRWVQTQKPKPKSQNNGSKLINEDRNVELAKWVELSNAYKTYDELKTKDGAMDFGDLIVKTLKLFRQRPNVLKEYHKKFKYILVDEFQDTNISQNELVKLLAGKEKNITVVLDDDQSIYRFRGAAVSNALFFRKNFPKAKIISLTKNYRSDQEILDKAYDLIQFNNPDRLEIIEKIDKKLVAVRKVSGSNFEKVGFIHEDRVENEADGVSKKIDEIMKEGRYEYRDFAILVRANNHADPFVRALSRWGIPHQFLGPGRLFKQPEIVDLISYLKVLYDFDDSVSMYRFLSIDYLDISPRDLIKITNYAKWKNLSLFQACEKITDIFVTSETKEKINRLLKIISDQQKIINKNTAGQLLYNFLNDSGLIVKLLNPDTPLAEKRAKNISKFFDKLKTYEAEHEDAGVTSVVDWIDLASELGESPLAADTDWGDINAVNILTVHSSKGLEFPVVFLVNLVSQRFPTTERSEKIPIPDELIKEVLPKGDYHLQEERRLFYVGMTRAKDALYLTAADYYGEGKREKKLSPFIFEALGDTVSKAELSTVGDQQLTFLDYKPLVTKQETSDGDQKPVYIDYLSYSQIETFRTCPLHYKLKYIYKLPTPPSSSQSFGNTFHGVMKEFYDFVKIGKKPSEELMDSILEKKWIPEGYLGKGHEERSYNKMKKFLKHYLKNLFDPKVLPIQTEQPFTVRVGDLSIGGKIDRVDADRTGIHIIDYKTGANPLTQKEADNNLQLSVYALAGTLIPEYPFNRKPQDVKLSLYYFDNPQIVTTYRTAKQLDDAKNEIFEVRSEIQKSDFKCSHGYLCDEMECEYKIFCRSDNE
jgi:DNA helicase-2/ATP-dependent DNA helicase PcrA